MTDDELVFLGRMIVVVAILTVLVGLGAAVSSPASAHDAARLLGL